MDDERGKLYTNKVFQFIEEPLNHLRKEHYSPAIDKIAFSLDHVKIVVNSACGATIKEAMRSCHPYIDIRVGKYYSEKYI